MNLNEIRDQVIDNVYYQVIGIVYYLKIQSYNQVEDQVQDQVQEQVRNQVYNQVKFRLESCNTNHQIIKEIKNVI